MELSGAVAIVTGASRGVGAATAIELARAGATVVCAARATDAAPLPIPGTLDATARTITDAGGNALALPTNLARDDEVVAMVDTTVERFGRVDILVN
ncbi:MAG: SDR family NAD(P)-dependent oxidoreductase, partial [Acidimicrobiia bacterium]